MPATQASQAPQSTERRRTKRFEIPERPPITATAGGRIYTCYIEDISADGLRLRFQGPMPRGPVIALDHPVAGTLCGSCTWREGDAIGVQLQLPRSELERILRCICMVL